MTTISRSTTGHPAWGDAPRVVLVSPDPLPRRRTAHGLERAGFGVDEAGTAAAALALLRSPHAAVVVSEWLPDADGRDLCLALRGAGHAAPLLLVGRHDTLADRLAAFAAEADDYVPGGTDADEIAARLRAMIRRRAAPVAPAGGGALDVDAMALRVGPGRVPLTPTEFRILRRLAATPEGVTRRRLHSAGWPDGGSRSDTALDTCIARLRSKLASIPGSPRIVTARGVGYALRTGDGAEAA